ncbi:LIM domain only protein 7 isoform X3 [Oryzias melastigma]|uniref:LIM domain only protein 7 isoform X3 n=1 Tax=Oryzias melastigma TaxID=30732 RepID=UPI000CF7C9D2|nr:LIM domain only protein 7 isoform X3 [Oryzias melastigma]
MEGKLHVRSGSLDVSQSEQLHGRAAESKHIGMEWRQQTSISCADAFSEAQRWIEEVTGKSFGCSDFRAALENGVLLCDLINQLKPGIIKRMNRLSTPIAGLDNVNVFLKACGKLGLNESQLFHPGDLQDLSTRVTLRHDESKRRLKNVLITIYWLGRKAQLDSFYSGPQLNFKAFEGLLGLALSKALEDGSNVLGRDGGHKERHELETEERRRTAPGVSRGNSVEHIEFLQTYLSQNDEGCGSDAESEQVYRMEDRPSSANRNKGYVPTPLRKKQVRDDNARRGVSPLPRSKSLSDIPMVYPVSKVTNGSLYGKDKNIGSASEWNQDKRRCSVAAKDSEAQWQDDLNKWKTRRRSGKSDLLRSSQDREHVITQMTNGAMADFEKNEAQGPIKRDHIIWKHHSVPSPYSISPPSKASGSDFRPHTSAPLARSNATEVPCSPKNATQSSPELSVKPQPASDQSILGEDTYIASLASDGATTPSVQQSFTSQTQVQTAWSRASPQYIPEQTKPKNASTQQFSSLIETTQPKEILISTKRHTLAPRLSSSDKSTLYIESKENVSTTNFDKDGAATTQDFLHQNYKSQEESQKSHGEPAGGAKFQPAASSSKYLSRSLTWSTSAGLPRGYRQSESCIRLSPAITIAPRPFGSKQPRVSSLPRVLSVEDSQGLPLSIEKNDSHCPPSKLGLKRQTAAAHLRGQYQASVRQKKANQAKQKHAEQREDANNAAFSGMQPSLQTTLHPQKAYTRTLPQPYTSPQYYSSSDSHFPLSSTFDVFKAEHSDMRVTLTLKPNSVPDFGFKTVWDSQGARIKTVQPGSPAELCRLRADDEIVAVDGVAVMHLNHNLWKDKMASSLQTGTLTMDIRRYGVKDWSSNEESHKNQPAQSRMTLNLAAAPVLIGCADRQNSAEMTDAQESKLNEQSPNIKEVKATSGEPKDDLVASRSKGGSESAISDQLQVPSLRPSSSSWSWDSEEDRRRLEKWQEEQERLLQEQYQRDQERLEAEWQRAQQDAVEGRKTENVFDLSHESFSSSQHHVNGWTKKSQEERQSPERDLKESERKHRNHVQCVHTEKTAEKDWAEGSCGFARLSSAYRAKSLSTSALAAPSRQTTGDQSKRKGRLSKAEQERQQILEEMKKRNQLLTDNSWIRQRSNSFHKDAPSMSIKRYESLDNLDVLRQPPDPSPTLTYPRSNSATGSYCTPTRAASSRYSTGSVPPGRNAYVEHGSAWRTCCVCERVLGSGAAMVIEALSLFFHYTCFQCVGCNRNLGGTKSRVQVRVRNRKLYCEHCYFQLKSSGAFLI